MTRWAPDELQAIAAGDDLHVAPFRPDGRLGTPTWEFKRDRRVTRPLDDVLWHQHGLPYLKPEVQLLLKAKGLRLKDQQDFDAAAPLLDVSAAAWLRQSLTTVHPGHAWLAALAPRAVGPTEPVY